MSSPGSSRRALVTGATGFIGSHLVTRLLAEGWTTAILVRPRAHQHDGEPAVAVHEYDATIESVRKAVAESRPDVVFHLASLFLPAHEPAQVKRLVDSNILFGAQLLEAMTVQGARRLVNAGSYWQHYRDRPYDPVCLYAATKQAFEAILAFFVNARYMSAITLTLFDTYGPGDPRPKLLPRLQAAAAEGRALQMSPGEQLLSLVHIDDVIAAFLLAADRLLSGAVAGSSNYVVNADLPISVRELVKVFGEVCGRTVDVEWGARPYRPREMMAPWSGGVRLPTWKPKIPLEEGLRRLAPAVEGHPELPERRMGLEGDSTA
jgi:nucleoside-diphosphate-sugar epimerase